MRVIFDSSEYPCDSVYNSPLKKHNIFLYESASF